MAGGQQCALAWQVAYGSVTIATTGENGPLLAGSLCSILVSAFVCIVVCSLRPLLFPRAYHHQDMVLAKHAMSCRCTSARASQQSCEGLRRGVRR